MCDVRDARYQVMWQQDGKSQIENFTAKEKRKAERRHAELKGKPGVTLLSLWDTRSNPMSDLLRF